MLSDLCILVPPLPIVRERFDWRIVEASRNKRGRVCCINGEVSKSYIIRIGSRVISETNQLTEITILEMRLDGMAKPNRDVYTLECLLLRVARVSPWELYLFTLPIIPYRTFERCDA